MDLKNSIRGYHIIQGRGDSSLNKDGENGDRNRGWYDIYFDIKLKRHHDGFIVVRIKIREKLRLAQSICFRNCGYEVTNYWDGKHKVNK